MKCRIPLIAAVVGALLVGGATAGSTRASWTDQAPLASSAVTAGGIQAGLSAAPSTLSIAKGSTARTFVTVTDASEGKKLSRRLTTSASATAGVQVAVTTASGNPLSCGTTAPTDYTGSLGGSYAVCVTVTVPSSVTATAADVTVSVLGQQLLGGNPAGWSRSSAVVVPITITSPATSSPSIVCNAANSNGFSWAVVPNAVDYTVLSSSQQASGYSAVVTQTSRSHLPNVTGQSTTFWRVTANNSAGPSASSNTLRITRSGSTYTCTPVTP